ncbi:hypothetical protein J4464_05590 [Candidatus Woesearchaeota archaeon]|nr:hypothetical protein [Candidatus Woesearchaeota archaeon]
MSMYRGEKTMDQLQRLDKYTRDIATLEDLENTVVQLLKDAAPLAVLLAKNPGQAHYPSAAANRVHEGRHNRDALTDAQINLAYLNSPLLSAPLRDEVDATTVFWDGVYALVEDNFTRRGIMDDSKLKIQHVADGVSANMETIGMNGGLLYETLPLEHGLKNRIFERRYLRDHPEIATAQKRTDLGCELVHS